MHQSETSPQSLVSCDWLARHLHDPHLRILEVSASPDDTVYRQGHIPNAVWWHWKSTLWHLTNAYTLARQ